jgi:hypothetical protein
MHNFQMRLSPSSIFFGCIYMGFTLRLSLLLDFIFTFSKGTTLFLHKYLTEGIIPIGIPFFRPTVESR